MKTGCTLQGVSKEKTLCASNSPPMKGRGGVCNFLFFRKIIPHPNPSPRVGRGAPFGSRRSFLKPFIIFDTPPFGLHCFCTV